MRRHGRQKFPSRSICIRGSSVVEKERRPLNGVKKRDVDLSEGLDLADGAGSTLAELLAIGTLVKANGDLVADGDGTVVLLAGW